MSRTFNIAPAVRESVPLFVGVFGCSGSGKTYSSLRLASGVQSVYGREIVVIDTEARRSLHYAERFKFQHLSFGAPFTPEDYLAAIEAAMAMNPGVIVIDSMSHEHTGPGGVLEMHEAELDRMAGNDWKKREKCTMAAWIKPKAQRRKLIQRLLQVGASTAFVLCFRAREVTKPVRGEGGKTDIVPMGFMPEGGNEYLFEMAAAALLPPGSKGVPEWNPELKGEQMMTKLPEQFVGILNDGKPLSEEHGRKLAEWAKGGVPAPKTSEPIDAQALTDLGHSKAAEGALVFDAWVKSLTPAQKRAIPQAERDAMKEKAGAV